MTFLFSALGWRGIAVAAGLLILATGALVLKHELTVRDQALFGQGVATQQAREAEQAERDQADAAAIDQRNAAAALAAVGEAHAERDAAQSRLTQLQLEIAHAPASDDGPLAPLSRRGLVELRDGPTPAGPGGGDAPGVAAAPAGAAGPPAGAGHPG